MDDEDLHADPFDYYGDRYTWSQHQTKALRWRWDLFYGLEDNKGIIEGLRGELLAAAWKYCREKPSAPS